MREQIQTEALFALLDTGKGGTIGLSTGTGKSKIAIDYLKITQPLRVIIVKPRDNLTHNWLQELAKWDIHHQTGKMFRYSVGNKTKLVQIEIENIQAIYKTEGSVYDLAILDEIHTAVTEEYSAFLKNNTFKHIVGLSATLETHKEEKRALYSEYAPIVYTYYDSAKDNIVNGRQYYVLERPLSENLYYFPLLKWTTTEEEAYGYIAKMLFKAEVEMLVQAGRSQDAKTYIAGVPLEIGTNTFFKDASYWAWQKKGTPSQIKAAWKYLRWIKIRKEFLLTLPENVILAKKIIAGLDKHRILVFSELTSQISQIIPTAIHSNRPKKENEIILSRFNNKEISVIGSSKMLELGLNLTEADTAIFESYLGSKTGVTQKLGRLDRLSLSNTASVIIFKIVGTNAETWYQNSGLASMSAIHFDDVDELIKRVKNDSNR